MPSSTPWASGDPPDPAAFNAVRALFAGYRRTTRAGDTDPELQPRRIISPTGFTPAPFADTYRRVDEVGLTLDDRLAAMLVGTSLRFLSFHTIRQVLDLSAYFAEATGTRAACLARTEGIHVADEEAFVAMADTWVRKKVTLIGRTEILAAVSSAEIQRAAGEFGIEVRTVRANGRDADGASRREGRAEGAPEVPRRRTTTARRSRAGTT